jgi:hypothetical protein
METSMSNNSHNILGHNGGTIAAQPENEPHHITAAEHSVAVGLDRQAEIVPLERLTPYKGNARKHSKAQIQRIADSIARFGFNAPVLIDHHGQIIAGHGRVEAAKKLGLSGVPARRLPHLSAAEKRAYILADNKLAEKAGWDHELLAIELQGLIDLDFEVDLTGFETHHRELAMASGEMTKEGFTDLLATAFRHLAAHSREGSIHDVCIDWSHLEEMMAAGNSVYSELKNVCVWAKTNAGMGSFYRSRHELVFIWKSGSAPHINNLGLGQHGRNRSNVWEYPGISTIRAGRLEKLALHPTVKPVGLVVDAVKDCSRRDGIVLDPFLGSGTTVIAAERTGRRARGLELDPVYVDVAIKRWHDYAGKAATLAANGRTFEEVAEERASSVEAPAVDRTQPSDFKEAA